MRPLMVRLLSGSKKVFLLHYNLFVLAFFIMKTKKKRPSLGYQIGDGMKYLAEMFLFDCSCHGSAV